MFLLEKSLNRSPNFPVYLGLVGLRSGRLTFGRDRMRDAF